MLRCPLQRTEVPRDAYSSDEEDDEDPGNRRITRMSGVRMYSNSDFINSFHLT